MIKNLDGYVFKQSYLQNHTIHVVRLFVFSWNQLNVTAFSLKTGLKMLLKYIIALECINVIVSYEELFFLYFYRWRT